MAIFTRRQNNNPRTIFGAPAPEAEQGIFAPRKKPTIFTPINNVASRQYFQTKPNVFGPIVDESAKERLQALGKIPETILQAIPRGAKGLALSSAEYQAKKGYRAPIESTFAPTSRLEKFIFGEEPIRSAQEIGRQKVEKKKQELEQGLTPALEKDLKELGMTKEEYIQDQLRRVGATAPALALGGMLLDTFAAGPEGAADDIVKALAKTNKAEDVAKLLSTTTKFTDDVVQTIAPRIAATTNEAEVANILREATPTPKAPVVKNLPYNQVEYEDFLNKIGTTDAEYRAQLARQGIDDIKLADETAPKFESVRRVEDAVERAKAGEQFGVRPERGVIPKPEPITRVMRNELENMGYAKGDISLLNANQARNIIEEAKPGFFDNLPKKPARVAEAALTPEQAAKINEMTDYRSILIEQLKDAPGRRLSAFISKKEGQFMDLPTKDARFSAAKNAAIEARQKKVMKAAESAFEGTQWAERYDDPDAIREAIDKYNSLKTQIKEATESIKNYREFVRKGKLMQKDELAIQRFLDQGARKTQREADQATRLAERKKALEEGMARAKAEAAEKARKEENIRKAHRESDKPLNFIQKIINKLFPTKGIDKEAGDALRSWHSKRVKAPILAEKEMGTINVPRDQGLNVILDYQAGKSTKYSQAISNKFDALFKEAEKRGLDFDYRENYLPQVYRESSDEIKDKIRDYLTSRGMTADDIALYIEGKPLPTGVASNLKLTPYFAKDRVFPDYKTAMEWGLTPRFTDIDQLAAHYRAELEKTIANKELLEDLISQGKLIPEQVAPASWVPVQNLPLGQRGYYANPRLADVLDGMFKNTEELSPLGHALDLTARLSRTMQEIALSAGIPKSNINFFSIGQTIKEITAGNLKAIPAFLRANFNKPSIKFFEKNRDYLEMMAQEGIDVGDRVGNYSKVYENWAQQFKQTIRDIKPTKKATMETGKSFYKLAGDGFDKLFNEKTFGSFMPQLYTQTFKDEYRAAIKAGMSTVEARKLAADITKQMFGMIENVGRSKGTRDALTSALFAPKFRESIINTLYKTGKAGADFLYHLGGLHGKLDPSLKRNRKLLAGMVISFGAYDALNYKLNGNHMWENPPGKEFALRIPRKNGDPVYVEFMPSFLAFARNMVSGGVALVRGDIPTARRKFGTLLSMPVKIVMDVVGNSDYFENPIYKDTDKTGTKALKIAKYVGLQVNHPYIKELINQINNKKPLYESLVAATELPLKFSTQEKEATNKFYESLRKASIEKARAKEKVKPVYNQVQDLISQGRSDEAQTIVDGLSDEEYKLYKELKSADKTRKTKAGEAAMFDTVLKVKGLIESGKTEEAQAIVNSLSDEEYRLYRLAKERLPASEQY